jgi:hypothetical protein
MYETEDGIIVSSIGQNNYGRHQLMTMRIDQRHAEAMNDLQCQSKQKLFHCSLVQK